MLKENRKTLILTSLLTLLPILAGVCLWNRLPDPMATHFGFNNEADGYTSKFIAVFGMPILLAALEWVAAVVTANDPKKQNISPKMFGFALWLIPLISLAGGAATYSYNLGYRPDTVTVAGLLLGFVFVVIGNYLPKARQNYTIGLKIPWTLANEENWNRTHRLAGYLWTVCGALMIILVLTGNGRPELMAVTAAVMVLVPSVYSFLLHTRRGL